MRLCLLLCTVFVCVRERESNKYTGLFLTSKRLKCLPKSKNRMEIHLQLPGLVDPSDSSSICAHTPALKGKQQSKISKDGSRAAGQNFQVGSPCCHLSSSYSSAYIFRLFPRPPATPLEPCLPNPSTLSLGP